jgi:DNA-binding HxlR family transcriptional regulator
MAAPAEPRVCSIARTLEVVGEKWALLAVREVFLGNHRFDQMIRRTGAPRDTLTARLRALVAAGILQRRQYSDHPQRFEYDLTAAGRELYPVILTLLRWGDEHLAGPEGPPLVLEHRCGHRLIPEVTCQACGEVVEPADTARRTPTDT